MAKVKEKVAQMDTTDVDRYVGKQVGGGQLKEPVTVTDIRRWVQGMQYPNPLHYEEEVAAKSPFGRIVAPQSFAVCCDVGHGATPAIVGNIPGSHMIFGGDEWWFSGPRIFPGDQIRMDRRFHDYKVTETKFAGPTMFSRGDTRYTNQRGEHVATQRSTAVRYFAEEARARGFFEKSAPRPKWTQEEVDEFTERRLAWIRSRRGPEKLLWQDVKEGESLPQRVIGPHDIRTLTTEWRSFTMTVWGSSVHSGPDHIQQAGWLDEMSRDLDTAKLDPSIADGLYRGPSGGHAESQHAQIIGMPRGYGYGATMGAWCLDYIAMWAGDHALIRHSNVQYRFPYFEDDVTFMDAEIVDKQEDPRLGSSLVIVELTMSNQDNAVLAKGPVEVELPTS